MPKTNFDFRKRSRKLAEQTSNRGLGCIAITSTPSLRYFFNYVGKSYERFCCGLISRDGDKTAIVVPALDRAKAEKSIADAVFSWTDNEGFEDALSSAAKEVRFQSPKIGCETSLSLGTMESIRSVLGELNFESVTEDAARLREIKEQQELESIIKSTQILAKGYHFLVDVIKPGLSEAEVGFELRRFLIEKGAESVEFCAVQSGENTAIPHSETTTKKIRRGDMLVVDVGCTASGGYVSDFTRTYVIGKATQKQKQIYEIVKKAQSTAASGVEEGRRAEEIDGLARKVIEDSGYGKYFVHRTGHGIGLEAHEPPWIKEGNESVLRAGMVFTVEPGLYLPGRFGVRIEDDVIIGRNDGKVANLTGLSHELEEL